MTKNTDVLGFSPPLFISSTDKGVLSLYKEQALSVLLRAPLSQNITDYVEGVLFTSEREKLERLDSLKLTIKSTGNGPTRFALSDIDRWRLGAFNTTARGYLTLGRLFPERQAAALVADMEDRIRDAQKLFPDKKEYAVYFWTMTRNIGFVFHEDTYFGLSRDYSAGGIETGPRFIFEQRGAAYDHHYYCTDSNQLRSTQAGDVTILQLNLPHRGGTSSPAGKPKLRFSVYGY